MKKNIEEKKRAEAERTQMTRHEKLTPIRIHKNPTKREATARKGCQGVRGRRGKKICTPRFLVSSADKLAAFSRDRGGLNAT